jgi:DNA-binding response OmpR family regulator
MMQAPVLIALKDDIKPNMYTVTQDVSIIGRDEEMCQIVVPDKQVSRIHATIERKGVYCYLHDANSANGTFVNGRRIREPHLLRDQDTLGLGPGPALLRFDDSEKTTQVLPRLYYDEATMKFFLNKEALALTPNEFRLFYHLYKHIGEVCLRRSCAEAVWEREYDPGPDDEGLHKLITKIRKKLAMIDPEAREILVNHHGMGYQLDV